MAVMVTKIWNEMGVKILFVIFAFIIVASSPGINNLFSMIRSCTSMIGVLLSTALSWGNNRTLKK